MKNKKTLVTGGSGFLGKRLQEFYPDWTYISSRDCNLTKTSETMSVFFDVKPDVVIHLAGRVGGIKDNSENPATFLHDNVLINTNVVEATRKSGCKRLLAALSTCAFPDKLQNYPYTEDDLYDGPPALGNLPYGMTKRLLHVQCQAYRNQYDVNYSTFTPSNLYGPHDNYDNDYSHFISALLRKLAAAKPGDTIEIWGTGKPLRQPLYVDDLCEILPKLILKHNSDLPLLITPDENLSITEMCDISRRVIKKQVDFVFNKKMDGQFRKDGSNFALKSLIGNYKFTVFESGFAKSYKWYKSLKR